MQNSTVTCCIRSYFSAEQEVNEFILDLEKYILYNNIPEKNILILKCSFRRDTIMENIGNIYVNDVSKYENKAVALRKVLPAVRDKNILLI